MAVRPVRGHRWRRYQQAEDPVSQLVNDFGPPVASSSAARQRAAMPFIHLERELWDLRNAAGQEIAPDASERRAWLLDRGAVGRFRLPVEHLLADPKTLAAVRLLLDLHFTPVLADLICAAVDLDVPALDLAGNGRAAQAVARLRPRRRGFAEEVLRAYAYGITEDQRIRVSNLYVARNEAGMAVHALAGKPLLVPRPQLPKVDVIHISWHDNQVFRGSMRN